MLVSDAFGLDGFLSGEKLLFSLEGRCLLLVVGALLTGYLRGGVQASVREDNKG